MSYFNFNGKILKENTAIIHPDNRGLRFGDGLFETIKFKNDELILADDHFARLWQGLKLLQYTIPKLFTPDLLEEKITELIRKNNHTNARIRLTVTRGHGGLYDLHNNQPQYIIQSWELPESNGSLNQNGLELCIYKKAFKMADGFSAIKHNNFLPYFMGAIYAKDEKCNDAIILNQHGKIADTTIANIFFIKNGSIYTTALSDGCIAGTMRQFIISSLKSKGITVEEKSTSVEELLEADEVFLTNAIYNIRWVGSIGKKRFRNTSIIEIYQLLEKTNPAVFC